MVGRPRRNKEEPTEEQQPQQQQQQPDSFEARLVSATLARLLPKLDMEAVAAEVADRAAEHLAGSLGLARVAEQLADRLAGHLAEDGETSGRVAGAVVDRLLLAEAPPLQLKSLPE
jgi:hypothetical protein